MAYLVYVLSVLIFLRVTSSPESRSSSFLEAMELATNYGLWLGDLLAIEVIAASLGLRGAGRGLVFGEFIVINR